MLIYVEIINGKKLTLEVNPTDTIEQVKLQLEVKEGIPHNQQTLFFSCRRLEDYHILDNIGCIGKTLQMRIKVLDHCGHVELPHVNSLVLSSSVTKRVRREIQSLQRQMEELGVTKIQESLPSNNVIVTFLGPPNTPYQGGQFSFLFQFPQDYPFKPPRICLLTPIWHPNFLFEEKMEHNIGSMAICSIFSDQWSPAFTMARVLIPILINRMADPTQTCLTNLSKKFLDNKIGEERKARDMTWVYGFQRGWTKELHYVFPSKFKVVVKIFLLVLERLGMYLGDTLGLILEIVGREAVCEYLSSIKNRFHFPQADFE